MPKIIPPEFDKKIYRELYDDLKHLNDNALYQHYINHGKSEGRRANGLENRNDFVKLIPPSSKVLEIGPFNNPLTKHVNFVKYFDVLSSADLIKRAKKLGLDTKRVPSNIHYVSPNADLSIISEKFEIILSSHVIEHQTDLLSHLKEIYRLLLAEGYYFILIPDKRYCFDHFIPESNLCTVIEAHHLKPKVHRLGSVLEHRVLTTHNESMLHWNGIHGDPSNQLNSRLSAALEEYKESHGKYIDVHAWYFTPNSFTQLVSSIRQIDRNFFDVESIYPTRHGQNEFWVILKKPKIP